MPVTAGELLAPARAFVRGHLAKADKPVAARRYRFEHSLRVAAIGRLVGSELDPDLLELGCILHDVGKWDAEKPVDHGRAGALLVTDWLTDHGLPVAQVDELAQGIAMHTDGLWNPREDEEGTGQDAAGRPYRRFDSEPTVLARSIGDCDNVDRFSAYRIFDTLRYVRFLDMTTFEQHEFCVDYLANLERQREYQCATPAAQALWTDRLDFQTTYVERLKAEVATAL